MHAHFLRAVWIQEANSMFRGKSETAETLHERSEGSGSALARRKASKP
jgi:hypothetical protein